MCIRDRYWSLQMLKKMMSVLLVLLPSCLAFFDLGDAQLITVKIVGRSPNQNYSLKSDLHLDIKVGLSKICWQRSQLSGLSLTPSVRESESFLCQNVVPPNECVCTSVSHFLYPVVTLCLHPLAVDHRSIFFSLTDPTRSGQWHFLRGNKATWYRKKKGWKRSRWTHGCSRPAPENMWMLLQFSTVNFVSCNLWFTNATPGVLWLFFC